jgi:hypothetical protein
MQSTFSYIQQTHVHIVCQALVIGRKYLRKSGVATVAARCPQWSFGNNSQVWDFEILLPTAQQFHLVRSTS